jgi:Protein of unknown function (DUF3108)
MMALTLSLAAAVIPYAPEEQMDFSIDYLGVTMGRARIAVGRQEGGALPVILLARTTGMIAVVDVREQLSSVLDLETGLPRIFTLDAVEPGYRHTDTARFDRLSNKATVREKGKYDNTYDVDVPAGTVDFVALVFRLRTLPLEPGASHDFPVLFGRKVSRVTATVEAREKVSTPAGEFAAVKVRVPTGLTGKFSEKNPTYVWFSDDARRIVVRLSTDFAIGRAEAELSGYRPGKTEAAASTAAAEPSRAAPR